MSRARVNQIDPFSSAGVGIGSPPTGTDAILELAAGIKGFLPARGTTAQRNAIPSPRDGLTYYNTDTHVLEHYNSFTSAWESVDGIQSINGLTSKAQFFNTSLTGIAPAFTQSGGNTNTLSIPLASSSGATAGLLSNSDYVSFNGRMFPTKNVRYVVKNTILGPQCFSSISAALASITDSSDVNQYIVIVGPGEWIETEMTVASGIIVAGMRQYQCIVYPATASQNLFNMSNLSHLSEMLIRNVGAGYVAVKCDNPGSYVLCHKIGTESCDIGFQIIGSSVDSYLYMENCYTAGGTRGIDIVSSGGYVALVNTDNYYNYADFVSGINPDRGISCVGTASQVNSASFGFEGLGTTGDAFYLENGATARLKGGHIFGWDTGLNVANSGAASTLLSNAVQCRDNGTYDLNVAHPGAIGSFQGQMQSDKVYVNPAASAFKLSYLDSVSANSGSITLGELRQGDQADRLLSISKLARKTSPLGVYTGGTLADSGGLNLDVEAGAGFLEDSIDGFALEVSWVDLTLALPANSSVYITVDDEGTVSSSVSLPNQLNNLILGRAVTTGSTVEFIERSSVNSLHLSSRIEKYQRKYLGPIYDTGSLVTEGTAFKLNVSPGTFAFGNTEYAPTGGNDIEFDLFYQNGSGGYTLVSAQDTVNSTQYDDGTGTLASLTAGYYAKHALYVVGDGIDEKYLMVLAQTQYSTKIVAEGSDLPTPPGSFTDGVTLIASIIVKQGSTSILPDGQIRDERPTVQFKASGVSASATHGNLLGLLADDHPQYLRTDGSRTLTGSQNYGGFAITNLASVNGIVPEAHASRHLPNGADPLATAAPIANITALTSNSIGTANSMARSDHGHAVSIGPAASQFPDQANAPGSSANLAAADHIHLLSTAAPITAIGANSAFLQGVAATFSRSDHGHTLAMGVPVTQVPDQSNAAGISNNLARADHNHLIATGVPVAIGDANAQGASTAFSRNDHVHAHGSQTNPAHHAIATLSLSGFMSAADKTKLDGLPSSAVPTSRILTAGSGLTGGGDLSADRTFSMPNVGTAGTYGSASQVPVFTTDAQGRVSAVANTSISILSAAVSDFTSSVLGTLLTGYTAGSNTALAATDSILAAFGKTQGQINARALSATTLTAGVGLTGGGDLSANRTFDIAANADGSIVVNANDIQIGIIATDAQHGVRGGGTQHASATTSVAGFMSAADKTKLDAVVLYRKVLGAPDFDDPNNADWPITVAAELTVDSVSAAIPVRRFDGTTEEGVGFDLYLPTGAVNLVLTMIWRAQTAPGSTQGVQPSLRVREQPNNAAIEAWVETDMTALSVPTNANWQYSSQTISLSTLSLVAGRKANFELTRQPADPDDTLTGDWVLDTLIIEVTT